MAILFGNIAPDGAKLYAASGLVPSYLPRGSLGFDSYLTPIKSVLTACFLNSNFPFLPHLPRIPSVSIPYLSRTI